jgi:prolyl oligopeptidase
MSRLTSTPPVSAIEPVTEVLHGVEVTDPYRWLEDQSSLRTRVWLEEQARYARAYLNGIPGREEIRTRVRQFLAIETCDSFLKAGNRYFFRKRLADQEQAAIYVREGTQRRDRLLIDPAARGTGKFTAVKPVRVSPDGKLLLYEIKEGGERTGTFALLDIETGRTLPDVLPRGYLRGFAFAPSGQAFYYVHERSDSSRPFYRAAYYHDLGSEFSADQEIFSAGEDEKVRLCLTADSAHLGFLIYRYAEKTRTSLYIQLLERTSPAKCIVADADFSLGPLLVHGKVLAITDRDAPNLRIVRLDCAETFEPRWTDLVPESDSRIHQWIVADHYILVSYVRDAETRVSVFDLDGKKAGEWPVRTGDRTIRFLAASPENDKVILESESFTHPAATLLCSVRTNNFELWAERKIPFDAESYSDRCVWYRSKDGTRIPMSLVGRRDVLAHGSHPAIMTAYGGYGVSMTPQFSVFVAFLIERGCLFAVPNVRGGGEFGAEWHNAAKRRSRQVAYDDFLSAAQWLIETGRTKPEKLAIFGGSNSGLLVGAALTQRPELFRAVVCIAPMLDMLRYHLFDNAHVWQDEFGTVEDAEDFAALSQYSPYQRVRDGVAYPATMIVSGDADQNCNPLHARKMTARLQAANSSERPIFLAYGRLRGHSPVLPLSERIEALTDRMAFLSDQLQLAV